MHVLGGLISFISQGIKANKKMIARELRRSKSRKLIFTLKSKGQAIGDRVKEFGQTQVCPKA
jgi:hypothetical protein